MSRSRKSVNVSLTGYKKNMKRKVMRTRLLHTRISQSRNFIRRRIHIEALLN